jgi:hypothetical protein
MVLPFAVDEYEIFTISLSFLLLFILTAKGFLPGGSGTTIRQHNTHHTK